MAPSTASPAPGSKKRPKQLTKQKSGIFEGVFSYVSQELHNFVVSATGTAQEEDFDGDESSSSYGSGDEEDSLEEQGFEPVETPTRRPRSSRPGSPSPLVLKKRSRSSSNDHQHRRNPPSSTAIKPILSRKPAGPIMPGSLYPLSPTHNSDDESEARHVHFRGLSSSDPVDLTNEEFDNQPGPSSQRRQPTTPPKKAQVPALTRTPSSVQVAVARFRVDRADPSILLPKKVDSPTRIATNSGPSSSLSRTSSSTTNRKEPICELRDSGREGRSPRSQSPAPSLSVSSSKTKGKAPAHGPFDFSSTDHGDQPTSKQIQIQITETNAAIKRSEGSTSEEDKQRIKALEEEVHRLREELSRRPPVTGTYTYQFPPPPPPPPPPPGGHIVRVPTQDENLGSTLFSVRASLRHAGTPKEKPINRLGLPAVGLPPDKVAAFLTEMKTVRLRKVGDRSFSSEGDLTRQPSSWTPAPSTLRIHHSDLSIQVGEKRKRRESDYDMRNDNSILSRVMKRRSMFDTAGDSSFTSTPRLPLRSGSTSFESTVSASSQPQTSSSNVVLRENGIIRDWRASTTQAQAPTPSLCSDQDGESHEDFNPPTPPLVFAEVPPEEHKGPEDTYTYQVKLRVPDENEEHEIRLEDPQQSLAQQLPSNLFQKRPPRSPLPSNSPRRPRPPLRSTSRILRSPPPPSIIHGSDDEEPAPLAAPFMSKIPVRLKTGTPHPTKKRRSDHTLSAQSPSHGTSSATSTSTTAPAAVAQPPRRHQTLDEELRMAVPLLTEEELEELESDGDVFTAVGSMEPRGFLAHGGAGGTPVYVDPGPDTPPRFR